MKIKYLLFLLVLGSWLLVPGSAHAKPQRLEIQSRENKQKKAQAKALAKSVDLSKVSDPQARLALQAIFDSLNLKDKKEVAGR